MDYSNKLLNENTNTIKRNTTPKSKHGNKCSFNGCNKKLSITSIRCKCNKIFCNSHSFYIEHDCTYDYKTEYKTELIKKNKRIKVSKIEKI